MSQKDRPKSKTDDITDNIVKGIKDFFGIKTSSNKSSPMALPRCFGVYRSSQNDAENCCEDCIKNKACFTAFKEKQEKTKAQTTASIPKSDVPPRILKPKISPTPQHNPEKEFLNTFRRLTNQHRAWDIWKDFVIMFACALSNAVDKTHYDEREALYMETINKYNKHEQSLFSKLIVRG